MRHVFVFGNLSGKRLLFVLKFFQLMYLLVYLQN